MLSIAQAGASEPLRARHGFLVEVVLIMLLSNAISSKPWAQPISGMDSDQTCHILLPRVLTVFSQLVVAERDSGVMEKILFLYIGCSL